MLPILFHPVRFPHIPVCFVRKSFFYLFFVFIYAYWCPTRFLCQMILVLFNGDTTYATSEIGTAYPSICNLVHPRFIVRFQLLNHQFLIKHFVDLCICVCPFFVFFVLSDLLQYTSSDYPWYVQAFLTTISFISWLIY